MHMTFYWGRDVTLLFDFWKTATWTDYSLTLLACFFFSLFYQYLESFRLRLKSLSSPPKSLSEPLISTGKTTSSRWGKVAGAAIFGANSAVGYMLMLAIMSFNGGVFVAVVVGLTVGYLAFRSGDDDVAVVIDNPCACA